MTYGMRLWLYHDVCVEIMKHSNREMSVKYRAEYVDVTSCGSIFRLLLPPLQNAS